MIAPKSPDLASLAVQFTLLSLLAVGGVNSVVPEMHRQTVEVGGWLTDRQFTDLFAMAQVAPGPNVIVVTLIGYAVAGIGGALVATGAMIGPSCVLAYFAGRAWQRFQAAQWRIIVQRALVPISVGLIGASALILARAADNSAAAVGLTVITAATSYFTRINPLWMFLLAAIVGYTGLV
jgi:chromate transporter